MEQLSLMLEEVSPPRLFKLPQHHEMPGYVYLPHRKPKFANCRHHHSKNSIKCSIGWPIPKFACTQAIPFTLSAVQRTLTPTSAFSSSRLLCKIAHRGYWRLREKGVRAPSPFQFSSPSTLSTPDGLVSLSNYGLFKTGGSD